MSGSGMFSCCPCGMFKLRTDTRAQATDKYKMTTDDDYYKRVVDDDDDDKYIVPLDHTESVIPESNVSVKANPIQRGHNEEDLFAARFQDVSDDDGEIDAWQLRDILNQGVTDVKFDGFGLDVCRSMVALGDNNLSGQMSYEEAKQVHDQLHRWKVAYVTFDADRNGYFHTGELQKLLETLGYQVCERTVHAMAARYADKQSRIYYVDFVSCMLKFTSMYEAYRYKQNNNPSFTSDEFIQLTMYS